MNGNNTQASFGTVAPLMVDLWPILSLVHALATPYSTPVTKHAFSRLGFRYAVASFAHRKP
jgi:hypothetical protein